MTTSKHILVPVDFSPSSLSAAGYACELARAFAGRVALLHVVEPPMIITPDVMILPPVQNLTYDEYAEKRANQDLQKLAAEVAGHSKIDVLVETLVGHPRATIVEFATEGGYDHIVMGTHGRTGLGRFLLGSVAEYVVRHATCMVTTVRAPAEI